MSLQVMLVNKYIRIGLLGSLFFLISGNLLAQNKFLSAPISLEVNNQKIGTVLAQMERSSGYSFSFNSNHIPTDSLVSIKATNVKTEFLLRRLLGSDVQLRESGRHIIIIHPQASSQQPTNKKVQYTISGYIRNNKTGSTITNASVYHVGEGVSVLTDKTGFYELVVDARENEFTSITYSRRGFMDTVIIVQPFSDQSIEVALSPKAPKMEMLPTLEVQNVPSPTLDTLGLVRLMVTNNMLEQTINLNEIHERRFAQASVIPNIGTNRKMSGVITNNLSFNLLAGYSQGVNGVEIGGFGNMNRGDVNGMQIGGFGNILGGKVNGLQVGGFFNFNLGRMNGLQISGFSNTVIDTLTGLQLTGFSNIVRGDMSGTQVSGFSNLALADVNGGQISGFSNVALGNVNVMQMAGFANYGKNVNGLQVSGFGNVAKDTVRGLQMAGFINYAHEVRSSQISGYMNIVPGEMHGIQIAGFLNHAHHVKGVQIGFINISDSMQGVPIGFFSYVRKGYHKVEIGASTLFPTAVDFKTGVYKLYNIFSGGYVNRGYGALFAPGYGLGTEWGKRKFHFGLDVIAYQQIDPDEGLDGLDLVASTRLIISYPLGKRVRLVAGPTFETQITERLHPETGDPLTITAPYSTFDNGSASTRIIGWFGGRAAVRF